MLGDVVVGPADAGVGFELAMGYQPNRKLQGRNIRQQPDEIGHGLALSKMCDADAAARGKQLPGCEPVVAPVAKPFPVDVEAT